MTSTLTRREKVGHAHREEHYVKTDTREDGPVRTAADWSDAFTKPTNAKDCCQTLEARSRCKEGLSPTGFRGSTALLTP